MPDPVSGIKVQSNVPGRLISSSDLFLGVERVPPYKVMDINYHFRGTLKSYQGNETQTKERM